MHAVVAEIFAHGAARERRQELHRRRIGCGRGDDDRVFERAALFEDLHELRDGRALLADGDIDAIELFGVGPGLVDGLLVQDGVENDRGLAGLAVADDQLALAAADRDQRVDGLEARRHRLVHRAARDDAGRLHVDAAAFGRLDRALAVDRIAERVDDAAKQALADRHVDDRAGALDDVAFLDVAVGAEDDDADIVAFEVQRHAADAAGELDHLAGLDVVEAVDAGDAVADGQHLADFGDLGLLAEILDLVFQNCGNFRGADVHQPTSFSASLSELSLVLSDVSIWREPILTTRPPSSDGSTVAEIATSLPVTPFSAALSSVSWSPVSGCAEVTSAATSPRCSAAMRAERLDHGGDGEKPPVSGDDAQEIADKAGDFGLVGDRRDGLVLLIRRKHRASDHAGEIVASVEQRLEAAEVGFDLRHGVRLEGKFEQRTRIAFGNTGDWRAGLCHGSSFLLSGRPRVSSRQPKSWLNPWPHWIFPTVSVRAPHPLSKVDCRLAQAFGDRNTLAGRRFRHYCRTACGPRASALRIHCSMPKAKPSGSAARIRSMASQTQL